MAEFHRGRCKVIVPPYPSLQDKRVQMVTYEKNLYFDQVIEEDMAPSKNSHLQEVPTVTQEHQVFGKYVRAEEYEMIYSEII